MEKVKPCPFCGKEPVTIEFPDLNETRCTIGCGNSLCFIHPYTPRMKTVESAVDIWNRRADDVNPD